MLKVIYIIEGTIINKTPLRVGSSNSQIIMSAVDNPVLMMRRGDLEVPVIPGSSWKGLLRSEVERLVRSTEELKETYGDVWRACDIIELTENEELRKKEEENPCVVCRVFGNTGIASHIRIFDSYPLGDYSLEVISRVAIDRVTGGQSPKRLFTVQVVSPLTKWNFEMQIINIDLSEESPERKLISYLFGRIISGLQIGGGKSVGYGLVNIDEKSVRVKEIRTGKEGLASKSYEGVDALKELEVT